MPTACMKAYMMVVPTNLKPRFFRSLDMASDSGLVAGIFSFVRRVRARLAGREIVRLQFVRELAEELGVDAGQRVQLVTSQGTRSFKITGLIDSGMDITSAGSEADLRARFARRLGSPFR